MQANPHIAQLTEITLLRKSSVMNSSASISILSKNADSITYRPVNKFYILPLKKLLRLLQ